MPKWTRHTLEGVEHGRISRVVASRVRAPSDDRTHVKVSRAGSKLGVDARRLGQRVARLTEGSSSSDARHACVVRTRHRQPLKRQIANLREVGLHPVGRWAAGGELAGRVGREDPGDLAVVHPTERDGAPLGVVLRGHADQLGRKRELAAGRGGGDLERVACTNERVGELAGIVALALADRSVEFDVHLCNASDPRHTGTEVRSSRERKSKERWFEGNSSCSSGRNA